MEVAVVKQLIEYGLVIVSMDLEHADSGLASFTRISFKVIDCKAEN